MKALLSYENYEGRHLEPIKGKNKKQVVEKAEDFLKKHTARGTTSSGNLWDGYVPLFVFHDIKPAKNAPKRKRVLN